MDSMNASSVAVCAAGVVFVSVMVLSPDGKCESDSPKFCVSFWLRLHDATEFLSAIGGKCEIEILCRKWFVAVVKTGVLIVEIFPQKLESVRRPAAAPTKNVRLRFGALDSKELCRRGCSKILAVGFVNL